MAKSADPPLVWAHAALLASLPFLRPSLVKAGGASVALPDVAVVLLWAVAAVSVVRGRLKLRVDPLLLATLAYIAVLAASAIFGTDQPVRKALLKLFAYSLYLLVPWLTTLVVTDERKLAFAAKAFLVGAAACVALDLVGVAAFYARLPAASKLACTTYGLLPSGNYPRMCVTFTSPNSLANYFILALGVLLGVRERFARRFAFVLGVAALTVAILFTLSAGFAGYALAAVLVLWAHLRDRERLTPVWRALLVVTAAGAMVLFTITMIAAFVPPGEGHVAIGSRDLKLFHGSRWAIWESTVDTIRAHPLLGKGYGTLVAQSDDPNVILSPDQIKALAGGTTGMVQLEAHNLWLNVAGQAGLLGLGAFAVLMLQISKRLTLRRSEGAMPYLRAALTAGFAGAVLYHGLFGAFEESRNLWCFIGLLASAAALEHPGLRVLPTDGTG